MKQLVYFSFALMILSACNPPKNTGGDNTQNSLDWQGVYSGVVPCADCEGILTRITLRGDNTYDLQTNYLGKSNAVNTNSGNFEWNKEKNGIILKNIKEGTVPSQYKVGENRLVQLDMQGNAMTGALAGNYILIKGGSGIENRYWKLIEVNGKSVQPNDKRRKEPHLILHPEGRRVSGSGGCNNFTGTYQLQQNNRLSFSPLAATKMACLDADNTEDLLFKALTTADSYYAAGDTLQLIRARMAPLAKFVTVYLR